LGFVILALLAAGLYLPAEAAPRYQLTAFPTPTPGLDGRILYVVQSGDTLDRIAGLAGITVDDLRLLNNLDPGETVIVPGQILLLGQVVEPTAAPEQATAAAAASPTPTEGPGTGIICVLLFNDVNGDALRQEEEEAIPGGAISVSERNGLYSNTANTVEGLDPICFEDLPEGDYNVTAAIPDGYNPTTVLNKAFKVSAGDDANINFGAQLGSGGQSGSSAEDGGRSPLLGVFGVALLLLGIGIALMLTGVGMRIYSNRKGQR